MFVAAAVIARNGIEALIQGTGPTISALTFVVVIFTLIAKAALLLWQRKQAADLQSEILVADASQLQNDVLVTLAVLIGLIATSSGFMWVDSILGFVVASVIVYTGLSLIRTSSTVLMDSIHIDPNLVEKVAQSVQGVHYCHAVRTRGRPDEIFMDLHIHVDPQISVQQGHHIAHEVEESVKKDFAAVRDVVVHVEPYISKTHKTHKSDHPSTYP